MVERKAVSTPAAAHDLEVYAKGVGLMRQRSQQNKTDPLGWTYQSLIHGRPGDDTHQAGDPADWRQCQHASWWFLPWHRMYLLQLERIIRSLTHEPDFALPYWDYPNASNLHIPPAFADQHSPLFDATRHVRQVTVAAPTWTASATFVAFGGPRMSQPSHTGMSFGSVESNPHNPVHGLVGGDMAAYQSPLDPLFWIHHCNIDRIWAIWLTLPGRKNPTDKAWLNQTWDFPDPDSANHRRSFKISDIATLAKAGYTYDNLTVPGAAPKFAAAAAGGGRGEERAMRKDDDLQLLAATDGGGSVDDAVSIAAPAPVRTAAAAPAAAAASGERGLFLQLENVGIDSADAGAMWNVFAQVPGGERHLVGTITPFGLAAHTAAGGRHTLTFDLSHVSDELLQPGAAIQISFEPVDEHVQAKPYWERAALYTTAE